MRTLKLIIPVILTLLISACVKTDTGTGNGKPGKGATLTITGTNRVEGAMNDSLVIGGTGFTTDTSKDIVTINDVRAPILSATATEIIAKIPVRAFSGNIVVHVGGQSVTGPMFQYLVTTGVVSTFAGNTNLGPGFSDGIGTNARFFGPVALALDSTGDLYVADLLNRRIRKITLQNASVTTFAGNGTYGDEDGDGASAEFGSINGIAVAKNGAVYVADADYNVIRAISTDGTLVTTIAGQAGQSGYSNNTALTSLFNKPMGLTFDNTGNLIIVDQGNNVLRELTTSSMDVTSLTTGTNGNFNQINGITYNARNSDVYVADAGSNQIKAFSVTAVYYTYFGNGILGYLNGIKGAPVEFNRPQGLAFDNNYNVYVADTFNNCIRMIDNQYNVTTLVGSTESGLADGTGAAAKFNEPYTVVVDNINHYLYVADTGNSCIRKVVLE
jgi:DNA-binding beta-propeller fold protein YncE